MKKVSIVLCCYNEVGNINAVVEAIQVNMPERYDYEVIAVDDGSTDGTFELLKEIAQKNRCLRYIELSRNFGHQNALKAGLDHASGDCVVSMDADMQHPPDMLSMMIAKWEEGYDIVYTRRKEDESLPFLKRKTSGLYYRILNILSSIEMERGTADFRLIDRNAVNILSSLKENELFFRGLVKWMGYKQYAIDYQPNERLSGDSKYTLKKMFRLAFQGITSFSIKPLFLSLYIGFFFAALSLLYIPYIIYAFISGRAISGWTSLIVTVIFFGGMQLFVMGIIGLYVGKSFMQTKQRPNYIIRSSNLMQSDRE